MYHKPASELGGPAKVQAKSHQRIAEPHWSLPERTLSRNVLSPASLRYAYRALVVLRNGRASGLERPEALDFLSLEAGGELLHALVITSGLGLDVGSLDATSCFKLYYAVCFRLVWIVLYSICWKRVCSLINTYWCSIYSGDFSLRIQFVCLPFVMESSWRRESSRRTRRGVYRSTTWGLQSFAVRAFRNMFKIS